MNPETISPTAAGREDVSDEYAAEVAAEDPSLVYMTRPDADADADEKLADAWRLEQQRDVLRDHADDEADYRRLCHEAGISPV